MAIQSINVPNLPRPLATVLSHMTITEIQEITRRTRGARLNELLDAAQDVTKSAPSFELQIAAQCILDAASVSHPDYFDPTLRGVY